MIIILIIIGLVFTTTTKHISSPPLYQLHIVNFTRINSTLTDSIKYAGGIFSPYNEYMYNMENLTYVSMVEVNMVGWA
jgi:hypothetical protein